MAALGILKTTGIGEKVKLNDSLISGAGTLDFSLPSHPNSGDFSTVFHAVGTVTTLTSALQISLDGVNFNDYVPSANFLSNTAPLLAVGPNLLVSSAPKPMLGGVTFRINITIASGSFDIWLVTN